VSCSGQRISMRPLNASCVLGDAQAWLPRTLPIVPLNQKKLQGRKQRGVEMGESVGAFASASPGGLRNLLTPGAGACVLIPLVSAYVVPVFCVGIRMSLPGSSAFSRLGFSPRFAPAISTTARTRIHQNKNGTNLLVSLEKSKGDYDLQSQNCCSQPRRGMGTEEALPSYLGVFLHHHT